MNKGPWLVYLAAAAWLVLGLLAVGACQPSDDRINRIILVPTPDASSRTTAFIANGVAVQRFRDRQAGVYCWVYYDDFYLMVSMSCLPEAQVTPATAWGMER